MIKSTSLLFFISIFLLTSCQVSAQKTTCTGNKKSLKYLEAGLKCYNEFDDKCAIKNFDLAIKADPKCADPYMAKAYMYKEKKEYSLAEECLLQVVAIDNKEFAEAYLVLGEIYHEQFKFGLAYKAYVDYLTNKRNLKEDRRIVYERLAYANYISDSLITHPVEFEPHNLGPNINSELGEYHPSLTGDGEYLIYTVRTKEPNPACPGSFADSGEENFYFSTKKNSEWQGRKDAGYPLNTPCLEGAANLSPDGRFIFFYSARNREDLYAHDAVKDIYYAEKEGNVWGPTLRLPSPVSTGSFESQPSFSSDGKTLYFTSNRPGGMGGDDIWKTTLNADGSWSEPVNLGPNINTVGNEISPFIHPDNQTFYFASDGRYGVGGHDFYFSRLDANGDFSEAQNIGYPINTPYDERSLVISADGTKGYFASKNIEGGFGDYDLYYFDLYKDARPVYTTYLKGHIFDDVSKASLQANFELIDVETGQTIVTSFSDANTGEFLVSIPEDRKYALNVNAEGYLFYSASFDMKLEDKQKPFLLDIGLKPIKVGETIVLNNIFFDTDMFDLKSESTVELQKLVALLNKNPKLKIEISGHTDNQGSKTHNQTLSQNRAKSVYDYLVSKGINANRLSYKGYGDTMPISDNNTEEGRKLNRRTEFKVTGI